MNREVCVLPDVMITSATPALAFLLYFWLLMPYNRQLKTLTIWSLRENLKPRPTILLGQHGKASV